MNRDILESSHRLLTKAEKLIGSSTEFSPDFTQQQDNSRHDPSKVPGFWCCMGSQLQRKYAQIANSVDDLCLTLL